MTMRDGASRPASKRARQHDALAAPVPTFLAHRSV